MKVLTLRQPWASLVSLGIKTIETRSWSTNFRGPLAIHAAARPVQPGRVGDYVAVKEADYSPDTPPFLVRWPECTPLDPKEPWRWLPLGAIVATCTLVDVVPIFASEAEGSHEGDDMWKPLVADCVYFELGFGQAPPVPVVVVGVDGRLRHWTHFVRESDEKWRSHNPTDVTNQRPYGDFAPGRFAWLLADVQPVDPPVPFRGGQGLTKTWDAA